MVAELEKEENLENALWDDVESVIRVDNSIPSLPLSVSAPSRKRNNSQLTDDDIQPSACEDIIQKQKYEENEARKKKCIRNMKFFSDWVPVKGDVVVVAFPGDCKCGKVNEIRKCVCKNIWWDGQVVSSLIYDRKKKVHGFNVDFDDGDSDHVEYYADEPGKNDRWVVNYF